MNITTKATPPPSEGVGVVGLDGNKFDAPICGGFSFLLLIGVAYGEKKLFDAREKSIEDQKLLKSKLFSITFVIKKWCVGSSTK